VTPEHLHALARTIWLNTDPDDTRAARSAEAVDRHFTGQPATRARATRWITTLHNYEAFQAMAGRTPRENTRARHTLDADERHLGEWARYQRRFEEHLNAYQRARLEVSPAFEWDLRAANWNRNLTAAHAHRQRTGTLPRLNSADPREFALGRWLGRALRDLHDKKLPADRANQLHELLDAWGPRH